MLHVKYLSDKLIGAKSRLYTFMLLTNNLKKHSTAITQVLNRNQQQQRKSRPDKQTRRLHLLTSNVCASEYTLVSQKYASNFRKSLHWHIENRKSIEDFLREVDEDSVSINNGEFQSKDVVGTFGKPF